MKVLNKINSPEDVKKLNYDEMNLLAEDIRKGILNRVDLVGGHIGPDLGVVELTIAMHYVFNSPTDKFVFDVSHQCYPHKMITGRKGGFIDPLNHLEISGYTNPKESPHDHFAIGHTSTSLTLATGLAKARDLKGERFNVIALIGDGSLSGGEAFEGFNNSSVLNSNFIIIVNDNEMSIAENQGGLYKNLAELRATNGECSNNWFKAFGFEYKYIENGNDIPTLIEELKKVKDIDHPIVLHVHTLKGKGYQPAVENKEGWHWSLPGILKENKKPSPPAYDTYEKVTYEYILDKQKTDKSVIAVCAATPGAFGWSKELRNNFTSYTDVGIAEQHATGYSSGLATGGAKPIFAVISSFIQRSYDQISQDIGLNNSPVTILVFWGGISNADMTHLQTFDIPLISNIPNIVYLAPTCKEEYLKMLDWSVEQIQYPVAIRVPSNELISTGTEDKTDYSKLNKSKVVEEGSGVAIFGLGSFMPLAKKVKEELKKSGINATIINPVYITGIDKELLEKLKENHKVVVTLEDGVLDGGWGEKISRFYGDSDMKVLNYGGFKEFTDRVSVEELYKRYRLTKEQISEDVIKAIKK